MRKKVTKKKLAKESTWFSKPIFYAMVCLTLASTITACTMIAKGISIYDESTTADVMDTPVDNTFKSVIEMDLESSPDATMTLVHDGVTEAIERIIDDKVHTSMTTHLLERHDFDAHSALLKCHQLGSNTFSCKFIQGKPIDVSDAELPFVETPIIEEPKVEEFREKESWNPFG